MEPKRADRRLLIEHHARVVAESQSPDRVGRSQRALERLRREQQEEADRLRRINAALPPASTIDGQIQRRVRDTTDEADGELEVIWSGGEGLTSY